MKKKVYSWLKVFSKTAQVKKAGTYNDLYKLIERGYFPSGSFHSYNKQALRPKIIQLDGMFKRVEYNKLCETIKVGAAVKIIDIMKELDKHGRRLLNSGNYFEQTAAGSIIGGTHGYGHNSALADSVLQFEGVFQTGSELVTLLCDDPSYLRAPTLRSVTFLILKTGEQQSFKVTNCVCNLSDVGPNDENISRAYAVLPYSDSKNPVCMVALYEPNRSVIVDDPKPQKQTQPWHWWRVKLWWKFDQYLPFTRKWIQRAINFIKLKPYVIYTHPRDLDSIYSPNPGMVGVTGKVSFIRNIYKPTHTSYNISVFCSPDQTKELIRFVIRESEALKSTLLRCFIGVRCLQGNSDVCFVGNAAGPVDAIDLYCTPKHAKYLIQLQEKIQHNFDVRPHYGKTVFR